jgi:hypothetical protein
MELADAIKEGLVEPPKDVGARDCTSGKEWFLRWTRIDAVDIFAL